MTVKALAEALALRPLASPEDDREIVGAYVGDLLSWVMGRAKADNVWVTIMTNLNVVAVASLADVSLVIIAEEAEIEPSVVAKAESQGVNLYTSPLTSYELAAKIASLI